MKYTIRFSSIALVVLLTFSFQILGVSNLAFAFTQTTSSSDPINPVFALGEKTKDISNTLSAIKDGLERGENMTALISDAESELKELLSLRSAVETELKETGNILEKFLSDGKISQEVLDRHTEFVSKTADGFNKFEEIASALSDLTSGETISHGNIEPILGAIEELTPKPELDIMGNKPQLTHRRSDIEKKDIESKPAITIGVSPYTSQDLSPTKDIQITEEINDLANQLNFDPIEIFSYVRNNIDYQPYFGSVKGSLGTYWEKAGNDMDQASFLIALFRASDIPSRYVSGMVELPIQKVMNWTGVKTPDVAVEIMATNGIPSEAVRSTGGVVTHLRFFHTWAEAYIPKSRKGAKSVTYEWVQMDPSYKQYMYVEGIDIKDAMGFDLEVFFNDATSGATINEAESWFTNLNESDITLNIENYSYNLLSWVDSNLPDATVGDVLGYREIKKKEKQELNNLSQTFPFKTFTPQYELSELPDHWRYRTLFQMYGFNYSITMPELAGKSLTLSYVPATPYDQWLIDYYGGLFNVPAYLVNMKPLLSLDGNIVSEGCGVTLGTYQTFRSNFLRPLSSNWDSNNKSVRTGAWYGLVFDHQRISIDYFRNRLDKLREAATNRTVSEDEMRLELIYNNGIGYFMMVDVLSELHAKMSNIIWTREPSQAFTAHDLVVYYIWGIPYMVKLGGLNIDVKRNILNPSSITGNIQDEVSWMISTGSVGSASEHAIFEVLCDLPSVSTEKILQVANNSSIPIYIIDEHNIDQILPQLNTFSIVKENIQNAINMGWTAIVPQRNIHFHDWYGAGWIIVDQDTGSAGYLIAGQLVTAGGNSGVAWAGDPYSKGQEVAEAGELMIDVYNNLINPGIEIAGAGLTLWWVAGYTAVGVGLVAGGGLWVVLGAIVYVDLLKTRTGQE